MPNPKKNLHSYFKKMLSEDKKRTRILSLTISTIVLVLSIFMCILNLFSGTLYLVLLTGGLAVVLLLIIYILNKTGKEKTGLYLLATSILVLLTLLLINGGIEGFSPIWILLLPTTGFSLFGLKAGSIICFTMLFIVLLVLWAPFFITLRYDYTQAFTWRFPIVYITCLFIGAALEYERETTQGIIKKSRAQLQQLSRIDELTKLENRRAFDRRLNQLWNEANKNQEPLSLLMIDIDYFKAYNDFYGHLEGDLVLIEVAKIISQSIVHDRDIAARWGGEEFTVLLPHDPLETANEKAERVRLAIAKQKIPHEKSMLHTKYITVSIGVSTSIPSETKNSRELLAMADTALYKAKKEGRNRIAS